MAAQSKGKFRQGEDVFLNIAWTAELDRQFEEWRKGDGKKADTEAILAGIVTRGLAVKLGAFKKSVYAYIENPARKEAGQVFILSGWADSYREALQVAWFKLAVVCDHDWDASFESSPTSLRR